MTCVPLPSIVYLWKIFFTIGTSSWFIDIFPLSTIYPNKLLPKTTPFSICRFCPHLTRSDVFLDSSWALLAIIVKRNSASTSLESILSNMNITPTSNCLSFRVYESVSTVFLANLETSFVIIRSILPFIASAIISLNPTLFLVCVPLIPSSQYTSINSQSGCPLM